MLWGSYPRNGWWPRIGVGDRLFASAIGRATVQRMSTLVANRGDTAIEAVDMGSVLASILRCVPRMTDHADPGGALDSLMRSAAVGIGGRLLAASTAEDFEDTINEILGESEIFHFESLAMGMLKAGKIPRSAVGALQEFSEVVLTQPAQHRLREALPLLAAWVRAQTVCADYVSEESSAMLESLGPRVLTSPEIPVEIAVAAFHAFRASACGLALGLAIDRQRRLRGWLGFVIIDTMAESVREHLRLLAAFPGVDVPDSILPAADRLDLRKIVKRHQRVRARIDAMFQEAEAR